MTLIACDIDDTLYSFNNLARETFVDVALLNGDKRLQRGAYCAWGEWRSPADVTDEDIWPQVIDRCHAPKVIRAQTPFPDAAETLQELVEQGHHLLFISNRKPEAWQATHDWLVGHDFPMGGASTLVCTLDSKARHMVHCQYLIDDRPKTLVEFVYSFTWMHKHGSENVEKRRKAFGLYMPYNAALTDVPGIKLAPNWKLLRQYMIDQDVLMDRLPPRSLVGTSN